MTELAIRSRDERGMTTAEYAVGTVASCGFAGLLITLLKSDWATSLIQSIIDTAVGWLF